MPTFDIVKESSFEKTFRVANLIGKYSLKNETIKEEFKGKIDIENSDWQIGCIYGASGTGKSTIAEELFKTELFTGFKKTKRSVIDDTPERSPKAVVPEPP